MFCHSLSTEAYTKLKKVPCYFVQSLPGLMRWALISRSMCWRRVQGSKRAMRWSDSFSGRLCSQFLACVRCPKDGEIAGAWLFREELRTSTKRPLACKRFFAQRLYLGECGSICSNVVLQNITLEVTRLVIQSSVIRGFERKVTSSQFSIFRYRSLKW